MRLPDDPDNGGHPERRGHGGAVAPAFGAVLTFVTTTRSAGLGFLFLLVFSLGMTTLLVGVGLLSGTLGALPRAGRWTVWIKRAGGVLLLGMAEYYFIRMGQVL